MADEQDEQGKNWWGSTLGKLKTALSRTKSAVVDSVIDAHETGEAQTAEESEGGVESSTRALSEAENTASTTAQTESESTPQATVATRDPVAPTVPQPVALKKPAQAAAKAVSPPRAIDEDYLEDLEEKLIKADLGLATVDTLVSDLKRGAKSKGWNSRDVEGFLKKEFASMLYTGDKSKLNFKQGTLNIYLVVGVNGVGKTTSIGKLAWRLKQEGKRVLMAAGDTFRAAAETQLEIWAGRAGVEIVRLPDGSDPGAVVYQAVKKAVEEGFDALVIDTAGRLHNKANLMAELKKVRSVIDKQAAGKPLESLLVLDASTGQNGLQQAKVFTEAAGLTGVILTKLDGSAKGGVVFSIARELKIPVKLIGLGEQIDDLRDFEPELFVEALFD